MLYNLSGIDAPVGCKLGGVVRPFPPVRHVTSPEWDVNAHNNAEVQYSRRSPNILAEGETLQLCKLQYSMP